MSGFSERLLHVRILDSGATTIAFLCDEDGKPFRNHIESTLETRHNGRPTLTVKFLIDGQNILIDLNALNVKDLGKGDTGRAGG